MKIFAFLALMLLTGASIQQQVMTGSCSATDSQNANSIALAWLQRKGITLNPRPETTTDASVCGTEFTTAGTCCKIDDIKKFVEGNNNAMIAKWKGFIGKIARVKGKFLNGLKKLMPKMNSKDMLAKANLMRTANILASKFSDALDLVPIDDAQIEQSKMWINDFDKNLAEFKTQGKACFDTMKKARANFFCAVCSGNAFKYTEVQSTNEVRLRVASDGCSTIVNQCYPIWKFNFYLTSLLQFINVNKNKKNKDGDNKWASEQKVSSDQLKSLREAFAKCSIDANTKALKCDTTGSSATVTDFYARICRVAFSVTKSNAYVEGSEEVDSGLNDDDSDKTADETEVDTSKSGVVKRLMQNIQSAEPTFGIEPTTTGNIFGSIIADNTGIIPGTSVDTSKAGESATSVGYPITLCFSLLIAFVLTL